MQGGEVTPKEFLQEQKAKLSHDILQLIYKFNQETGFSAGIEVIKTVQQTFNRNLDERIYYHVKVLIEL